MFEVLHIAARAQKFSEKTTPCILNNALKFATFMFCEKGRKTAGALPPIGMESSGLSFQFRAPSLQRL